MERSGVHGKKRWLESASRRDASVVELSEKLSVIPLQSVRAVKAFQFCHKCLSFMMQFLVLHIIYDGIERVAVF